MPNANELRMTGHLTRDPQLKYLPNNTAVCEFGLAVNRSYKKGDEWKTEVCFIDVTTFAELAEEVSQRFKSGSALSFGGYLKFDQWTGQDGNKKSKHRAVAMEVSIPVYRKRDQQSDRKASPQGEPRDDGPPNDADIPF